jgi:hypothetical protein
MVVAMTPARSPVLGGMVVIMLVGMAELDDTY